jgi:predicted neuraminidase
MNDECCAVEGCSVAVFSKELCRNHYAVQWRAAKAAAMTTKRCSSCKQHHLLSEFWPTDHRCKPCSRAMLRLRKNTITAAKTTSAAEDRQLSAVFNDWRETEPGELVASMGLIVWNELRMAA